MSARSDFRMGVFNAVPGSSLTSTIQPVTDRDFIKNDLRAEQTRFENFTVSEFHIEGRPVDPQIAGFFAIAGHNLSPGAEYRLLLYPTHASSTVIYNSAWQVFKQSGPVGYWQAGLDQYDGAALWQSGLDQYGDKSARLADTLVHWLDTPVPYHKWIIQFRHAYPLATPVPNTTRKQDAASGMMCFEAESGTVINKGAEKWSVTSDATASNGQFMARSGAIFYWNPHDGPSVSYTFTAARSGAHDIWLRLKTGASTANSLYTVFDGHNVGKIYPTTYTNWTWVKVRSATLVENAEHTVRLSARDYQFSVDKIVIQSAGAAAPTGTGPVESGYGVMAATDALTIRQFQIGRSYSFSNFTHGARFGYMGSPESKLSSSGYSVLSKAPRQARTMSLPFNNLSDADKIRLVSLERQIMGGSFIVSAYPQSPEWGRLAHSMLARFDDSLNFEHASPGVHRALLPLIEV